MKNMITCLVDTRTTGIRPLVAFILSTLAVVLCGTATVMGGGY